MQTIKKILIANRGEIAVRIIKTAREMGYFTIAVYTEQDRTDLHTKIADESWHLGSGSLAETYLNIDRIIDIAKNSLADAIHPGYGFLSENPDFSKACKKNNLIFIGPDEQAISMMGNKVEAAKFVSSLNVPLLDTKTGTPVELQKNVQENDFPLMIKAASGGGGKGMKIAYNKDELVKALESTAREAKNYFGNGEVYLEKYIENPRHIEIQVLGDKHGNYLHLNERECSVQRRHQKIIEEAPSPNVNKNLRDQMGEAALKIAREINYTGAGTVEFLVDEKKNFYFLEMNTRIQVEHPVTEMITGIDIVKEQIRIAEGNAIEWKQKDIEITGHAIEARIYAEDPANNFLPSPGKVQHFNYSANKDFRIDAGIQSGDSISTDYDPLIAKAVAWNENRNKAINSLINNLSKITITGIRNNLNYLSEILSSEPFTENYFTTNYIDHNNHVFINQLEEKRKSIDYRYLIAAYIFIHSFPANKTISEQAWKQIGYWRPYMQWRIHLPEKDTLVHFTRQGQTLSINTGTEYFKSKLIEITEHYVKLELNQQQKTIYFIKKKHLTELNFNGFHFDILHENYQSIIDNKQKQNNEIRNGEKVVSPMFGKVVNIQVQEDMQVKEGETLMILEAMKMENNILAAHDTIIKNIKVKVGEQVEDGQILIETY
jgi:3-methylcrotonyl-CoA carboxylase alpha subunit